MLSPNRGVSSPGGSAPFPLQGTGGGGGSAERVGGTQELPALWALYSHLGSKGRAGCSRQASLLREIRVTKNKTKQENPFVFQPHGCIQRQRLLHPFLCLSASPRLLLKIKIVLICLDGQPALQHVASIQQKHGAGYSESKNLTSLSGPAPLPPPLRGTQGTREGHCPTVPSQEKDENSHHL